MKIKRMYLCNTLLFALFVSAAQNSFANDDNILKDGSFEQPESGWTLFDQSRISSDQARSGKQSMTSWGISRTIPSPPFLLGGVSGSYQEFPADPDSRWRLTGYGLTPAALQGASVYGILQVSFFDAQGKDLGTVETAGDKVKAKISNQINPKSPAGEWIFQDTGVATAPANTAKIHAYTLYVDFSNSGTTQGVYFDDLKLCALDAEGGDGAACQ